MIPDAFDSMKNAIRGNKDKEMNSMMLLTKRFT